MRVKTELSERPPAFAVSRTEDRAVITFYTDAELLPRDEGEAWSAIAWTIECAWSDNIEERISKATDLWYAAAKAECYAQAAAAVRARRDELLAASDASMALDRLGLTVPSGSTFTAWLSVLKGIGDVLTGEVATYRQALRDITQQVGFPYDVRWPEAEK